MSQIKIDITYFGFLRVDFQKLSEMYLLPKNSKVHDLLIKLADKYGEIFNAHIFDPIIKTLKDDILININGVAIRQLQGLDTKLKNRDKIDFIPLFSGGG